jgi:PhzF family phenazine biosynthesis protein
MKLPLYQIDAFTGTRFRGNPAAVCPLESWLPDDLLQAIAAENNLSETAFCVAVADGWELRWFTPVTEVDLCGHATLAAAQVLFSTGRARVEEITFHSRSGPLCVRREDGLLTLDFPAKTPEPCPAPEALTAGLGRAPVSCLRAADYLAVFSSQREIEEITPDFGILRKLDLRGVIITAPGGECDFVSRFFAPNCGIDEDPVTGSAHCALTPFWAGRLGKTSLTARQLSRRGGELRCRLAGDRVLISGEAVLYLEGTITV